jgi:hypothetical protein
VEFTHTSTLYPADLQFGSGHVLEDLLKGTQPITELHCTPFSASQIIADQEGRKMTQEEFDALEKGIVVVPPLPISLDTELRISLQIIDKGSDAE